MDSLLVWNEVLTRFPRATRALLAARDLQRRTDTKFVLPPSRALDLLARLANDYACLPAGNSLIATYRTLYFDTDSLELFHAHRRGCRVRQKVRVRHYPDRRLSLLEIKSRRSNFETIKVSQSRPYNEDRLSAEDRQLVAQHARVGPELRPQVWTNFRRVTLLGLRTEERVTVDLEVVVEAGGVRRALDDVAIIEVKQWPLRRASVALTTLHAEHCRPTSFSKYCAAIAVFHPELHCGRLVPALRELKRGAA